MKWRSHTTQKERRVVAAAVAFVVWQNKVPMPANYESESARLRDALGDAIVELLGEDVWREATYSPAGWPE